MTNSLGKGLKIVDDDQFFGKRLKNSRRAVWTTPKEKGKDFEKFGICHRLFNFIMNSLIGRSLKRLTNQGPLDEYARNGVQEPLTSQAKSIGKEKVNSKLKDDDSDPTVKILFKQTDGLDYWPPDDKFGSSVHSAAKDDKAIMKRNKFADPSGKETPLRVDTAKLQFHGKTEARSQGAGSTCPPKIIIPIPNRASQNEKKEKAGDKFPTAKPATPVQPDASKPMLTGLGLNINEVSEVFIRNTKERMIKTSGNGA